MSDYKTDIEAIRKAKADYKELIKNIGTSGLKALCENAMSVLGATKVRWDQYTPYFNDGDPCYFRVTEAYFYIDGFEDEDTGEEDWFGQWGEYGSLYEKFNVDSTKPYGDPGRIFYTYSSPEQKLKHETITSMNEDLQGLEDVLLEVFGDHKQVTYENGGFTVEDYEHD